MNFKISKFVLDSTFFVYWKNGFFDIQQKICINYATCLIKTIVSTKCINLKRRFFIIILQEYSFRGDWRKIEMSPRLLPAILLAYILICEGFRIPLHLQHLDQRVLEKIAEKYGGNSLFYRGELIGNERTHAESKSIHAMRDAGIYYKKYILN